MTRMTARPRSIGAGPLPTLASGSVRGAGGTGAGAPGAGVVPGGATGAGAGGGRTNVTVLLPPKLTPVPIMKSLLSTARLADCDVPKKSWTGVYAVLSPP